MPLRPEKAVTPIAFVRAIVQAYAARGRDPAAALAVAQIAPALLQRSDARITATQMEVVSGAAMRELDDEALGWFSRRLPWGSYGLLCRASLTSPTLLVALKRWCRHHGLLVDDLTLRLEADAHAVSVTIDEHRPLGPGGAWREFGLVTLLRYLHGYACWLVDSRIPLREVAFPYPAPAHADAYPLMFPGPVRFGAPGAVLRFDAGYALLPPKRDERALRTMLQRALPLTVRPYRRDRLLVQRVREAMAAEPALTANAQALADRLHVSVRTLHRQLADEGASLQALKDAVRRERAEALLRRSGLSVKQVAAAVGFRSEKSFIRAFRGWTGVTPAAWPGA